MGSTGQTATATGVHHIGLSVANLDDALAFWEPFLDVPARWRTLLDRPYLGQHVGYLGVTLRAAFIDLPGGNTLELLDYQMPDKQALVAGTAQPGHVHFCLAVADARALWAHAIACGAQPVAPDGPVRIDAGPNNGAEVAYLRIHDGITLELYQSPPPKDPS